MIAVYGLRVFFFFYNSGISFMERSNMMVLFVGELLMSFRKGGIGRSLSLLGKMLDEINLER